MSTYAKGALVRVTGAFTTAAGTAQDPATVKVTVRKPNGQVSTYTYGTDAAVVKDSTGNYHLDVDANLPGRWVYRWFSTGAGQAADEEHFDVTDPETE